MNFVILCVVFPNHFTKDSTFEEYKAALTEIEYSMFITIPAESKKKSETKDNLEQLQKEVKKLFPELKSIYLIAYEPTDYENGKAHQTLADKNKTFR